MKYQVIDNGKIIHTAHNRKELLNYIKSLHNPLYYCTTGAHNYGCRTLCYIFNNIELDNKSNLRIVYIPK